ncbi:MAG: FtsX-like permease family protein [Vicinamibacterales bacterium]
MGVVANLKLSYGQPEEGATVFLPIGSLVSPLNRMLIRAAPGHTLRATDLQRAINPRMPDVRIGLTYVPDSIDAVLVHPRFRAALLGALALTGVLLAAVGLFAVGTYDAAARNHEIALRIALGAPPSHVRQLILRDAWISTALGALAGLGITWAIARLMQDFLFRTDAREPLYYVAAAAMLMISAGIGAWFPALRASRTDPITVLKAH